ncbi:MAG: TIGR02450 family Trp-rich protein [Gammaproteobacteria bacterium]
MSHNPINPRKLANSKWTAVKPNAKEKHFIVIRVLTDEEEQPQRCILEAVLTKRKLEVHWRELKSTDSWLFGWQ